MNRTTGTLIKRSVREGRNSCNSVSQKEYPRNGTVVVSGWIGRSWISREKRKMLSSEHTGVCRANADRTSCQPMTTHVRVCVGPVCVLGVGGRSHKNTAYLEGVIPIF